MSQNTLKNAFLVTVSHIIASTSRRRQPGSSFPFIPENFRSTFRWREFRVLQSSRLFIAIDYLSIICSLGFTMSATNPFSNTPSGAKPSRPPPTNPFGSSSVCIGCLINLLYHSNYLCCFVFSDRRACSAPKTIVSHKARSSCT